MHSSSCIKWPQISENFDLLDLFVVFATFELPELSKVIALIGLHMHQATQNKTPICLKYCTFNIQNPPTY